MKSYSKFTYQVLRSESPFSTVLLFSFEPFSLACRCQKTKGSRIIWLLPITIGGEKGVKQRSRQTFSRERKAGREWENRHISGPYSSEQSWRRFVLRLSPARSNRFLLRRFLFLWHPGKVAGCRLAGRARVPTLGFLCFPPPVHFIALLQDVTLTAESVAKRERECRPFTASRAIECRT